MATIDARLKKFETTLTKVVNVQRKQGAVLLEAVKRVNRLDGQRQALGLPTGRTTRPKALSSTRRTPPRETGIVPRGEWMSFEFIGGNSAKYWKVRLSGSSFITHWGRIGQNGQETVKRYASPAEAQSEGKKLIEAKLKKGYRLVF